MATASQYQIEKNVPVAYRQGGTGNARFPLAQMDVGDSFHVPWGEEDKLRLRNNLSNAIAAFQLRNKPKKFTSRKDELGIRVWRIT